MACPITVSGRGLPGIPRGAGNNMDSNNKAATQEIQIETGGFSAED